MQLSGRKQHYELTLEAHSVHEATFARHALGRLIRGSEGEALCRDAERTLRELGFADPGAIWALHFPELEG